MMRLCFTGSIPLHITTSSLWQSYDPMMRLCFTGSIPLHTTTSSLWQSYDISSLRQSYDPMMRLCFTGSMPLHTTNHVFMTVSWSYDETMFYRKHALTYHQPRLYDSLMILWWGYVLQEACPYIPLPHLYDSLMILWWDYVLQEACPYIPPTTSLF